MRVLCTVCYWGCSNRLYHSSARMRGTGEAVKIDRATGADLGSFCRFGIYGFSAESTLSCHSRSGDTVPRRHSSTGTSSQAVLAATGWGSGSHSSPKEGWQHCPPAREGSPLQLSHRLYRQDGSTWLQDEPHHWCCSAPNRQHVLEILPASVSPTPALHQREWPDLLPHPQWAETGSWAVGRVGGGPGAGCPGTSGLWVPPQDWCTVTPTFGPKTWSVQCSLSRDSG